MELAPGHRTPAEYRSLHRIFLNMAEARRSNPSTFLKRRRAWQHWFARKHRAVRPTWSVSLRVLSGCGDAGQRTAGDDDGVISSALLRPCRAAGCSLRRLPGLPAFVPFPEHDGWIRLNMKYAAGVPETYFAEFKRDFQALTEEASPCHA
jgi:hypothetical protein